MQELPDIDAGQPYGLLEPDELVTALKAAAEPTRLRILLLLRNGELNVKDLTQILGQSQPRLSRHLKLLNEAKLIERFKEGSWVYFHICDRARGGQLALQVLQAVSDDHPVVRRDRERANAVKREREQSAQQYFRNNAAAWDQIRSLHVSEAKVERAIRDSLGPGPFSLFVDLGTGTGRMLELFADRYHRGLGLDVNQSMLAYARSRLSDAGFDHAQVRHGDLYQLSLPTASADAIVMHQVLHFLSEPAHAIAEAARVLKPGGKLLIVDFAPHGLEFLRDKYAHARLGFAHEQMTQWLDDANLQLSAVRKLAPSHGSKTQSKSQNKTAAGTGCEKLTVSLWLAEQTRSPAPSGSNGRDDYTLEEIR